MGWIRRLKESFHDNGPWAVLSKLYFIGQDYWFDATYGVETNKCLGQQDLTIRSENKERGCPYQASRIFPLRRLFRLLAPLLPPERVFVDFGCGKGRVLMIASEVGFRDARGIEFARELCTIARSNCAAYKAATGTRTRFEIVETDVVDYGIRADENVFYLYNPFGEEVLKNVLDHIARSLESTPRKAMIIYYNPVLDHVIAKQGTFVQVSDLLFWDYRFLVYTNTPVHGKEGRL